MVDILSGVPSIVAALFVYAVWRTTLAYRGWGFLVAVALVLLMMPLVVRSTEEMLKIVPQDLRGRRPTPWVPEVEDDPAGRCRRPLSGIVTGVMLAIARVMGSPRRS